MPQSPSVHPAARRSQGERTRLDALRGSHLRVEIGTPRRESGTRQPLRQPIAPMSKIRRAKPADSAALAALAERTFRDAFAAQNTAEDMTRHCAASFSAEIQAREIRDPSLATLLSDEEGQLVGYAQLSWGVAPPQVAGARPAEIRRLYVDRRWHGRGVAQALMTEVFSLARRAASDRVWLGVWEHNPRAIAFYRKCGFEQVGEHRFRLGTDLQRDVVMVAPLKER